MLYVSLHTDDPDGGDQATHEADYHGYQRVALERYEKPLITSRGLRRFLGLEPIRDPHCDFPMGLSYSLVKFYGIGTARNGPGELLRRGHITPSIQVGPMVMPRLYISPDMREGLPE